MRPVTGLRNHALDVLDSSWNGDMRYANPRPCCRLTLSIVIFKHNPYFKEVVEVLQVKYPEGLARTSKPV